MTTTTLQASNPCSCGCTKEHVIATRETADGRRIQVWSNGVLTYSLGLFVRGIGTPRTRTGRNTQRRAVLAIADDIGLYDYAELATVVKIAAREHAKNYTSEADRRATIRIYVARALNKS